MVALHPIYFSVICTFFQAVKASEGDNLGIIGGKIISIEDAPYMAALFHSKNGYLFNPICGGSIIHKRFILTAAHCILGNHSIHVISRLVLVGSASISGNGQKILVEKEICHEEYKVQDRYNLNDICLLKLRWPLKFGKKVAQIILPINEDLKLEAGTPVNVTGWGRYSNNISSTARYLRQVTLPLVSRENCRKAYSKIRDTMICAGSEGLDSCQGDSGGPLTYNNIQVGLVSFGPKLCGTSNRPAIYTRVASFVDWVHKKIEANM